MAHTEELCEQAYECFRQVWTTSSNVCPLLLVRFWGKYTQDLAKHETTLGQILRHPSVLISTPQRMMNLLDDKIQHGESVLHNLQQSLGLLLSQSIFKSISHRSSGNLPIS